MLRKGFIYLAHIGVGAGLFVVVVPMIAIAFDKGDLVIGNRLIGWSALVVGGAAGLALAEWSRRRGTLVGNRR